jgi:hypothetical protein
MAIALDLQAMCYTCLHYIVGPEALEELQQDGVEWRCPSCDDGSTLHCRKEMQDLLAWVPQEVRVGLSNWNVPHVDMLLR